MSSVRSASFLVATFLVALSSGAQPLTLYVARDGQDGWSGRIPAPNAQKSDGPLASIGAARDTIRRLRRSGEAQGAIRVQIRAGTYFLGEPFILEPRDSNVMYEAFENERPMISGGRIVTGFRQNGRLWEASLPQFKEHGFHQMFVDGQRRPRARGPNSGYYRIAKLIPGPMDPTAKRAVARDRFIFADGDLRPFSRLGDVNLILMHSWETSIHPLKSIDEQTHTVEFAAPLKEWWTIGWWEEKQRYYVENAFELLDEPGEWYFNRETGLLSYMPKPGEQIEKAQVIIPALNELVRISGQPEEGKLVEHITFRGLRFQHCDWELSPNGNSSTQAAVEVPAAIMVDGGRDVGFENCEVAHVGTYGIWLRRGCKDSRIRGCTLSDLGAGGVRVGEAQPAKTDAAESTGNLVDNNHIHDGGQVYPAGVGVWLAQASHNRISHNDIHDMLYTGISVGWNWDDSPNRTHHNIIEFNHVHDLVHGVLSDAGLIYCLGVSPGSVIRNNLFHDIMPYQTPAFGWGIYLDATCGGYTVENNIVYNTHSGGLMYNNGGHEHTIRNNIFALSTTDALWPFFEIRPNTFERNIVYMERGRLFVPHSESTLKERVAKKQSLGTWNSNLYWHTGEKEQLKFYGRTFAQWKDLGLDGNSLIADPRFVDVAKRDFTLRAGSPAFGLGFRPIDTTQVGLRGRNVGSGDRSPP